MGMVALSALLVAGGTWMALTQPAEAQSRDCMRNLAGQTVCPPPKTLCLRELDNPAIKCSPPDGGILTNRYGKAVCGAGSCVVDLHGDVFCSKSAGGAASISIQSVPVCTDGCEAASAARCSTLSQ